MLKANRPKIRINEEHVNHLPRPSGCTSGCKYKMCGGCSLQNMDYKEQLIMKQKNVEKLFRDALKEKVSIQPVIGMENPYEYRNKGKYVFRFDRKNNKPIMGFYEEGTHKLVCVDKCNIQNPIIDEVAKYTLTLVDKYKIKIYDEDSMKGVLRYLIIRVGSKTNEIMVIFVTTDVKLPRREDIVKELTDKFRNIKTIVQNINIKKTNAILGNKNIKLFGNGYIQDVLYKYKFKISPLSFYQVNTVQTEKLYKKAIELAKLTKQEVVYDLYSGIGTTSLFLSEQAKKVYGVEIVEDAVKDAKENARINYVKNAQFLLGKVEDVLPRMYKSGTIPDVIFVDPPRIGLDKYTMKTLLEILPKKIIYISCNPESLVENLKVLKQHYSINEVQPVDMFPFTNHVECVCLLALKGKPR